jgi:phosphoglucomutase
VLAANDVEVMIDSSDGYTPTPAISHAILTYNPLFGTVNAAGVFAPSTTWPTATGILQARLYRLSVQVDW